MTLDKPLLMIPGPVEPYPEAREALASKVMMHYGESWLKIYLDTLEKLKKLFGTEQHAGIFLGPATAVMEMGINTIIEPDDDVIIVNKGFFINRFKEIVELYGGKTYQIAPEDYGSKVDIDELKYTIESINPKLVIAVHSETSTGVLEDIERISKTIPRETYFFVDAVSSFGALKLNCDRWNVDLCVGYSSKGLSAINGVVPFMASNKLWDRSTVKKGKGFILNLGTWKEYSRMWENHPYPVSLSSPLIIALKKASERVLREGLGNVQRRHYRISSIAREYIEEKLKLEMIPRQKDETPTVSVFKLPENIKSGDITKIMEEKYGIMISTTGLIDVNGLRIGHMGYTAYEKFLIPTLYALENILKKMLK